MKKKKYMMILLLVFTMLATGCTTYLKDENKKPVQNEVTGQNLVENILCQPESEETRAIYEKHNMDLNKLPKCSEFTITSGGYEGMWNSLFVKPLTWVIVMVGSLVKNYGLAVIIVTILIRLVLYPITKKTALQSELLKKARPELEKLEKKYKNKNTQEAQIQKSQEMMFIYKKYKISPFSGCIFAFIQIPLFLAFFESLNRLPVIFEGTLLGFQLGTTPGVGLSNGQIYYIILNILVATATYFSFKLNATAGMMGEDQAKQMRTMNIFSVVLISFMSFTVSTSICLYWIFNSGFTIIQNLLVKRGKKNAEII